MHTRFPPVAAALALAFAVPALVAQQKEGVNASKFVDTDTEVVEAVDAIALASQLADYGYDHDNVEALIASARILIDRPYQDEGRWEDGDSNPIGGGSTGTKQATPVTLDPQRILADAATMTEDAHFRAVITGMRTQAQSKGAVGGPIYASRRIDARATRWFNGTFRGNEYARVVVDGDGDTDLDCWIYDENGNLIDSDIDYTDYCILEFSPAWTGRFNLRVTNLGYVWNGAIITSN